MTDPGAYEPYRPPAPRPRGGLPGWAIAAIIVGSAVSFAAAFAIAAGTWLLAGTATGALAPPDQSQSQPPQAPVDPAPDPEPSPDPGSASDPATHIIDMYESYLAALSDGSIYDVVPGGRSVDPDYIGAFIYTLTDHRSAVRFMSVDRDAEELAELAAETDELERRFLAGEDLDVDVEITRADGSVFRSDGKYRTIEGSAAEDDAAASDADGTDGSEPTAP